MKIVLTDARTMNPGDISWDSFFKLGEVDIYDHTNQQDLHGRVGKADIIVTNKTMIDAETIDACPNLKLICVSATGYNNVDTNHAKAKGIPVCNAADYSSSSVGQHVIAMILNEYNSVAKYNETVHNGKWTNSIDFTYYDKPIEEISGKKFGIIGYGNLGKYVAKLALAFGAQVSVMSHPEKNITVPHEIELLEEDAFIRQNDIISIHVPLTDKTKGMINSEFLNKMQESALLVNTARGPIIDEEALAQTLKNNGIRAALIDVLSIEPPTSSPLFGLSNCTITPHQAWASKQSRQRLMEIVINNIASFYNGDIKNRVN